MEKLIYSFLIASSLVMVAGFADESVPQMDNSLWADHYSSAKQKLHHKSRNHQDALPANKSSQKRLVGRHVCTQNKVVMKPVQHMESYCKPTYQTYLRKCDHVGNAYCTGYRVVYELAYRVVEKIVAHTEISYACCPGWSHSNWSNECKKAVCAKECLNGGTCLKPNQCVCAPGWTGKLCETSMTKESKLSGVTSREIEEIKRRLLRLEKNMVSLLELKSRFDNLNQVVNSQLQDRKPDAAKEDRPARYGGGKQDPTDVGQNGGQHLMNKDTAMETAEDRINSLSEQMAILEERLADCTCVLRQDFPSLPNAR